MRLVDPGTGLDVATGEEGEVWVRGPNLMVGYHNQPEATAEALRDGWYHTGDLARRDAAGYLTVTGRIKELIIRNGENVHPGEIEDVLRQVPGVADAAVVGSQHDVLGEVPVAFIVPGPGGFDPEQLFATCRAKLANFKVPEELYEVDAHPAHAPPARSPRHTLLDRPARLRAASGGQHESLLRLSWLPVPSVRAANRPAPRTWALIGAGAADLTQTLVAAGASVGTYRDTAALREAISLGECLPDVAVLSVVDAAPELADRLRAWANDGWFAGCRLVVLTRGAVATGPDDAAPDPARAAVSGLLRALQLQHPNRFTLVDLDDHDDIDADAGVTVPALASDEPQLAIRSGVAFRPRLARTSAATDRNSELRLDPHGTLVLAGVTGPMGTALARHLVVEHGARHALLLNGTTELAAELEKAGARACVLACDVTDRDALAAALGELKRPITAVLHGAAESGDDTESIADGARHLHDLTEGSGLAAFLVLGSVAAALGTELDTDRAAANAVLDALVWSRRAKGLPAARVALAAGDLSTQECLSMVDVALATDLPHVVVTKISDATTPATVPGLLRDLIDVTAEAVAGAAKDTAELRARLTGLPVPEQEASCSTWSARKPSGSPGPPSTGAPEPAAASRSSASPRSPRSSCATASSPRPACRCPPRLPSTTRHRPCWPVTCAPSCSASTSARRRSS